MPTHHTPKKKTLKRWHDYKNLDSAKHSAQSRERKWDSGENVLKEFFHKELIKY